MSVRWLSPFLRVSLAGVNTALLLRAVARSRRMALTLLRCRFEEREATDHCFLSRSYERIDDMSDP